MISRAPIRSGAIGFTLAELLVAMAVLAIIVLLLNEVFSGASQAMAGSTKHLSADQEAQLVFSRMAGDFAGMVRRTDVDYLFVKQPAVGGSGPNDGFWFYSQAPGYPSPNVASTSPNPLSLVGYRIGTSPQNNLELERLGKLLPWDNSSSSNSSGAPYYAMAFILPNPNGTGWNPTTLIGGTPQSSGGTWPNSVGTFGNQFYVSSTTEPDYQAVGPDVFRLEYCFLLKDGTYSDYPVLKNIPTNWSGNPATSSFTFSTTGSGSPSTTGGSTTYTAGSRYYDTSGLEGYICTNANLTVTTWAPLGMQDAAAIVVAIAILDSNSRKVVSSASLNTLTTTSVFPNSNDSSALSDTPPQLMAQVWNTKIAGLAAAAGMPQTAAAQVRIYQRYFYLNQ